MRKEGRSVVYFLEDGPKGIENVSAAFLSVLWECINRRPPSSRR